MTSEQKNISFENNSALSVKVVKILGYIRLLLGNYVTISESRAICYLVKLYSIFVCTSVASIYVYVMIARGPTIFSFSVFEYTATVLIFFVYTDEHLIHFFIDIEMNERIMGFKKMSLITNYVYPVIFCNTFTRCCLSFFRLSKSIRSVSEFCTIWISVVAMDINFLVVIIIFSTLHGRVKHLRLFIESSSVPINIIGQNEIAESIRKVKKSLFYYDKLLDNMQRVDKVLQYELVIYWLAEFIRASFMIYIAMERYISETHLNLILRTDYSVVILNLMEVALSLVLISSPAVIVEATAYEVERIKTTLTTQILRCSDDSLRFELQTALQYVRLRPFRYTLCRAVSLDINLLFTTASLCITYVMVALQLTHFAA